MRRALATALLITAAACSAPTSGGEQAATTTATFPTVQPPSSEPDAGDNEETVIPGYDESTPLLSPSELEQVVASYGQCLGESADRTFIRFRAEPLYGVLMEVGVYSDSTGQAVQQLERDCMARTGIDPLIARYQAEHPLLPEDHVMIIEAFAACISASSTLRDQVPELGTADDLTQTVASLFPQLNQIDGQLLLDCSEEALYGPGIEYAESVGP